MIIRGECGRRVMVVDAGRTGIGKWCQRNGPIRWLTQTRQGLLHFPSTRVTGIVGYGRSRRILRPIKRYTGEEHGGESKPSVARAFRSRINSKRHGWRRGGGTGRDEVP